MPAMTLTLTAVPIDVETGVWCWSCALPSGYRASFAVCDSRTLRIVGRGNTAACRDCGERL